MEIWKKGRKCKIRIIQKKVNHDTDSIIQSNNPN